MGLRKLLKGVEFGGLKKGGWFWYLVIYIFEVVVGVFNFIVF